MTTASKTCFKCGETKTTEFFYRHAMMADGFLGKCIRCTRNDVTENRNKNPDYYRAYDKERGFRIYDPEKRLARVLARNIPRKPCEVCGNLKVDAHHDDYTKPYVVRFLCRKHHMEHHRRFDP